MRYYDLNIFHIKRLNVTLYEQLQKVRSEEDVKDAYIKALGLKSFTKGLIDIQTDVIWFEAKDTGKVSTYAMFTQLLHYVQVALNKGESVPPFLCVIDTEKAAIMKSADVLPFLAKKTIKWGQSASKFTPEALEEVSTHIGTHFVSFKIATHEEEFINTVKTAIKSGTIVRTAITPDNLKQVFDKWVDMIGREINGVSEEDYALLFLQTSCTMERSQPTPTYPQNFSTKTAHLSLVWVGEIMN